MQVLTFTFSVLSFCGAWQPVKWESKRHLRITYRLFSTTVICIISLFIVLQLLLFTAGHFDVNFVTDILFTLLAAISVCGKTINIVVRRKRVLELADMLLHSYCLPRDSEEIRMVKDVNEFIRIFTIVINGFAQMTLCCLLMIPVFDESHKCKLPCHIWVPYDLCDSRNFWLTWSCECGAFILFTMIKVTTDVLLSGFILQACLQLDILRHRLYKLFEILKNPQGRGQPSKESIQNFQGCTIGETILHHNHIIKYTRKVTETFDLIIIQQFVASALVLSVIIYKLSMDDTPKVQKLMAIGYFLCMTSELFSYCWFGNEVTLKGIEFGDDIYKSDWTLLSNKSKKNLMFIMLRTSRPIVMCFGSLIILNIESFKSVCRILKVTYSVLNVLKQSSTT